MPKISESEILDLILPLFGKCFEYYYKALVLNDLKTYFPTAPSYNYFIELIERVALPMSILAKLTCQQAEKRNLLQDAKRTVLTPPPNIKFLLKPPRKEIFYGVFGFKLPSQSQRTNVDFALTTGQVADNSKDLLNKL
ncbi:MAG: hypothetical protein IPH02_07185 [Sphingobacteriales bacterium]|nr:hypothetical protein [Sphingobacteriales bacterium]